MVPVATEDVHEALRVDAGGMAVTGRGSVALNQISVLGIGVLDSLLVLGQKLAVDVE